MCSTHDRKVPMTERERPNLQKVQLRKYLRPRRKVYELGGVGPPSTDVEKQIIGHGSSLVNGP